MKILENRMFMYVCVNVSKISPNRTAILERNSIR